MLKDVQVSDTKLYLQQDCELQCKNPLLDSLVRGRSVGGNRAWVKALLLKHCMSETQLQITLYFHDDEIKITLAGKVCPFQIPFVC